LEICLNPVFFCIFLRKIDIIPIVYEKT